jgi:5-methylcytosine-specific restriction endonuclease McrA
MSAHDNLSGQFPKEQKRAGGEKRGNSKDRAARKQWMLSPESGYGGDGNSVPCVHCITPVNKQTVESDRKIPGSQGGSYRRENVQPSCRPCNQARSDNESWTPPSEPPGAPALGKGGWPADSIGEGAH